jgi:hypothetical protein
MVRPARMLASALLMRMTGAGDAGSDAADTFTGSIERLTCAHAEFGLPEDNARGVLAML